jgi:hypothetical protein
LVIQRSKPSATESGASLPNPWSGPKQIPQSCPIVALQRLHHS